MILLPKRYRDHMVTHAQEGWPHEICGLLAGVRSAPVHAYRVTNADDNPRVRYTMEPTELYRALRDMERRSWDLYGIYHSHPASQAVPSATDRGMAIDAEAPAGEQARFPGTLYFIVSLRDREEPEVRAWRILEEASVEEEVKVVD